MKVSSNTNETIESNWFGMSRKTGRYDLIYSVAPYMSDSKETRRLPKSFSFKTKIVDESDEVVFEELIERPKRKRIMASTFFTTLGREANTQKKYKVSISNFTVDPNEVVEPITLIIEFKYSKNLP